MTGVTPGDVWRLYVKPSMRGQLIFRKKRVNRKSAKVLEKNKKFVETKPSVGCGHMTGEDGTYYGGEWHTIWKKFVACERKKAESLIGGPTSKYAIPKAA